MKKDFDVAKVFIGIVLFAFIVMQALLAVKWFIIAGLGGQ